MPTKMILAKNIFFLLVLNNLTSKIILEAQKFFLVFFLLLFNGKRIIDTVIDKTETF